jgi:hypothetical protein
MCDNCEEARREAEERADASPLRQVTPAPTTDDGEVDRRHVLEQAVQRRHARSHRVRALKIKRERNVPLASHGLGKGDVVRHKHWGEGEIVRVQGETVGAFFPGFGEKLLKASFLEKVDPGT